MSATSTHKSIPTRRVVVNHENELPSDYGTTPGGTLFGTTPGGTRIVYERAYLMQLRNSPLARTPPSNLPAIPGITTNLKEEKEDNSPSPSKLKTVQESTRENEDQFPMEI